MDPRKTGIWAKHFRLIHALFSIYHLTAIAGVFAWWFMCDFPLLWHRLDIADLMWYILFTQHVIWWPFHEIPIGYAFGLGNDRNRFPFASPGDFHFGFIDWRNQQILEIDNGQCLLPITSQVPDHVEYEWLFLLFAAYCDESKLYLILIT